MLRCIAKFLEQTSARYAIEVQEYVDIDDNIRFDTFLVDYNPSGMLPPDFVAVVEPDTDWTPRNRRIGQKVLASMAR